MRKKIDFRTVDLTIQRPVADANMTFAELVRAWVAETKNNDDLLRLKKWMDRLGDHVAWSITTDELLALSDFMLKNDYAPASVNRDIGAIGSAYKWIVNLRRVPAGFVSPTLSIKRHPEAMRVVEVDPKDIQCLRDLSMTYKDRRFPIYVNLLVDSGARKGELLPRRWGDIDLERRRIYLESEDTKTKKARTLFFTQATADLIKRMVPHRPENALVFPGTDPTTPKDYRASWRTLTEAAGLPDLHIHDLRHNRARELLLAGTSIAIASQIMGHSVQVLEKRYGTLAADDKQTAAEAAWAVAA